MVIADLILLYEVSPNDFFHVYPTDTLTSGVASSVPCYTLTGNVPYLVLIHPTILRGFAPQRSVFCMNVE